MARNYSEEEKREYLYRFKVSGKSKITYDKSTIKRKIAKSALLVCSIKTLSMIK